jgi:hypothetical protein
MNKNINTGICHRRIQENKPSFFVNWIDKAGDNQYKFFALRFEAENYKNKLQTT